MPAPFSGIVAPIHLTFRRSTPPTFRRLKEKARTRDSSGSGTRDAGPCTRFYTHFLLSFIGGSHTPSPDAIIFVMSSQGPEANMANHRV